MSAPTQSSPELIQDGAGDGEPVPVQHDSLDAGKFPQFDYGGALALARAFENLASAVEDTHAIRAEARDQAETSWKGDLGDDFETRNEDEDTSCKNVVEALRANAKSWAQVWAQTVDEANRVQRAHAWKKQQHLAKEADEGFQAADLDVLGLFTDSDSGLDESNLPRPKLAKVPAPPGFSKSYAPFARFDVSLDNITLWYSSSPPSTYEI